MVLLSHQYQMEGPIDSKNPCTPSTGACQQHRLHQRQPAQGEAYLTCFVIGRDGLSRLGAPYTMEYKWMLGKDLVLSLRDPHTCYRDCKQCSIPTVYEVPRSSMKFEHDILILYSLQRVHERCVVWGDASLLAQKQHEKVFEACLQVLHIMRATDVTCNMSHRHCFSHNQ